VLEGFLVCGEILEELLLFSIKLRNKLLFLSPYGRVTVSNGFANDHRVLFECPAVLDVFDVIHVRVLVEQLVVGLYFLLKGKHLALSYLL
jgi:hypothetical protein